MQAQSKATLWTDRPAALLGWLVAIAILLAFDLGLDRSFLSDQQNYLDNFSNAVSLNWAQAILAGDSLVKSLIIGVFSEEGVWQVWATALGWLLEPSTAILVTACAISVLLGLAVVRLPDPILPLILWFLLPVGFAAIGLLQLRQGFAFAVMMYVALRLERPVLATVLAAMIHSTFVLVVPFAVISWLCGRRYLLAVFLAVALAFSVAYIGNMLFELFGGRRLRIYSAGDTEATSIFYVFGALLCVLPSLHRLLMPQSVGESEGRRRVLANIAVVHVGVAAFVVTSFFIFPLGAGRVGYLVMLLLIPILPTMQRRDGAIGTALFALLALYLVYLTTKSALEGTYDIYFSG
jgi:hypothetical protein